jgi:hypothetical protein
MCSRQLWMYSTSAARNNVEFRLVVAEVNYVDILAGGRHHPIMRLFY